MKHFSLLLLLATFFTGVYAQTRTITGKVTDATTKEPLVGAGVMVKGTTTGTVTDVDGNFKLDVPADAKAIIVSYVGYIQRELALGSGATYNVAMELAIKDEVVVTSSRVAESIKEAPVQIEKMTSREIRNAASGDFYQSISNFKGIDMVTTSAGFKVINLRGFSDTRSLRTKQYIDGVDNEAPGLNFPVGNLVGANDLDLENIEIVSGAASALYGANAMQGIISMSTKNPFDHKGLSLQIKGGATTIPGPYFDAQLRYANTFGKNNKWAFKFSGEYLQMRDWEADDDSFNRYGAISADVNLSAILRARQYKEVGPDFTQEDKDNIIKLNGWLDFNPKANPGIINVKAPGYMERDLADYNAKSLKFAASIHHRFKDDLEFTGQYKFGYGTAVYQATARYQIKDFNFHQPMLQLRGKNFFVRSYAAIEDAGNSYNIGLTGAYLSRAAVSKYVSTYSSTYFDVIEQLTDFCADCIDQWQIDSARRAAVAAASQVWYPAGSQQFKDTFNRLVSDPNSLTGTRFFDKSALVHAEGQYNWDFVKWIDIITGASYRIYLPNSRGTIFEDTGGVKIRVHEVGAYLQATKRFFDGKLKVIGSARVDKNSNFNAQVSPRGSVVYTHKAKNSDHTFRFSATSAFRTPTLQDQYLYLDIGRIMLIGNLSGYDNLYTLKSVRDAEAIMRDCATNGSAADAAAAALVPVKVKPLRPERVTSFEIGYRAELSKRALIDFTAYYSIYRHFIGFTRVASPNADSTSNGVAGEESGITNVLTGFYRPFQLWVNSDGRVPSWGAVISVSYYVGKGITPYFNYTYADIDDTNLKNTGTTILSGFNTPRHKFNVGVNGNRVWKGLGFSANFKWVTSYEWQSPFGDGVVPSFHTLDAQVYYEIEKAYSTVRLGASNLYNRRRIEAIGSPYIGALYYAGWTFDFVNFGKKNTPQLPAN
ncbi:MAG: TonB-dependent receptor [Chitinophagales bacterium]|nr:TonB-dependent receptor [Chitinophagales bacterium]MDW8419615.1 carboxypeptidase-like regulatory domain-containing protein [Chitinophagales bacterium]